MRALANGLRIMALVATMANAATQEPAPAAEPADQEERIGELARRLGGPDRREAAAELYRIGAPAVSEIARRLEEGWPDADDEEEAWRAALSVLEHLGADAEPAYDTLVACLADPDREDLRDDIFTVLGRTAALDGERAREVSKKLGSECDRGGYFGESGFFALLSRLEHTADVELPVLVERLTHSNPYARELAAEALAGRAAEVRSDPELAERIVAALRVAIAAEHPETFDLAWEWNGRPAQTRGHADNGERIREAAAVALSCLVPDDPLAVTGLRARLRHVDPRIQVEAVRALGALGENAAGAVGDLARMLSQAHPLAAREAATALGMIGSDAEAAVSELEKAAESEDEQLAARARAALRQIDG